MTGMKLQLIHSRHHLRVLHQIEQMLRKKVADTDRAHFPFLVQLLHQLPCIQVQLFPVLIVRRRQRPVNQVQVKIICPESFKRLFKRRAHLLVPQLTLPGLRCNLKRAALQPALCPRLPEGLLRSIERCCIEIPITRPDCLADHPLCTIRRSLVGAESDFRDRHPVIQSELIRHGSPPVPAYINRNIRLIPLILQQEAKDITYLPQD